MTLFKKTQVGDRRWSREDVDRIKAMIVADFSELLNRQPAEGLQWASTKTDLVDLCGNRVCCSTSVACRSVSAAL